MLTKTRTQGLVFCLINTSRLDKASGGFALCLCLPLLISSHCLLEWFCVEALSGMALSGSPLMLQGTLGFASDFDFWKGLCNLRSVSMVHGLIIKCLVGLLPKQKALMCLSLPTLFSKSSFLVQINGAGFFSGGGGKEEEFCEYLTKNQFCFFKIFFPNFSVY